MRTFITLIICLISSVCYSQTVSGFVLNSTGNTISNASHTLDYSIGEIAITTISSPTNFLTQGVLQSSIVSVSTSVQKSTSTYMDVFPNPTTTTDGFVIKTDERIEKITVINTLGQVEYYYSKEIKTASKGLLIIFITTDKGNYTSKVIVN